MRCAMKIKFFAMLAIAFSLFSAAPALADYPPLLTWERGIQQTITLGGSTDATLWNLELRGPDGKSYPFTRSGKNKSGFYIYAINLPEKLKVGRYEIYTTALGADATLTSYVDVVPLKSYNIASDPKKIGFLATITFMIFSLVSTTRAEDFSKRRDNQPEHRVEPGEHHNQTTIDYKENLEDNELRGPVDEIGYGRLAFVRKLDANRFSISHYVAHYSPLVSRFASDGSWFQALFGPFVILLPAVSSLVGYLLARDTDMTKTLIPTNLTLVTIAVLIGIFDAASGALIAGIYIFYALATQNLVNAIDLRAILGLSLIFFAPVLLAGTIRPLRRDLEDWSATERAADIAIAALFSAFAIQGIFAALDGLSQQKTVLATYGLHFSVIAAGAIAIRFLCEDVARKLAPARLNYLVPTKKLSHEHSYFAASLLIRVALFLIFLYGFFGMSWQIFVAIVMLLIPQLLKHTNKDLPNIPALFQIVPSGLPQMVIMGFVGVLVSSWVNSLPLVAEDRSKTIVILLGIPGLILGILKSFGREPAEGDVKWYCRPRAKTIYYVGGLAMFAIAFAQEVGVFS
jgi:hypothetical protein